MKKIPKPMTLTTKKYNCAVRFIVQKAGSLKAVEIKTVDRHDNRDFLLYHVVNRSSPRVRSEQWLGSRCRYPPLSSKKSEEWSGHDSSNKSHDHEHSKDAL